MADSSNSLVVTGTRRVASMQRIQEKSKKKYILLVQEDLSKLEQVHRRGVQKELGLQKHIQDLYGAMMPSLLVEMAVIYVFNSTLVWET